MSWQFDGSYLTNEIVTSANLVHGQHHQHPPVDNFLPNEPVPTTNNSEIGVIMQGHHLTSAQNLGTPSTVLQPDVRGGLSPAQTLDQDHLAHFQPAATSFSFEELLLQRLNNNRGVSSLIQSINGGNNPITDSTPPLNQIDVLLDNGIEQSNNKPPTRSVSTLQRAEEPQKKEFRDQGQQVTFTKFNKPKVTKEEVNARRKEKRAQNQALVKKKPGEVLDPNDAEKKKHLEELIIARNAKNKERRMNRTEEQRKKENERNKLARRTKREDYLKKHPKPTEKDRKLATAIKRKEKRQEQNRLRAAAKLQESLDQAFDGDQFLKSQQ